MIRISVALVAFALVWFIRALLNGSLPWIWRTLVTMYRARYSLLAICGPAVLAYLALGPARSLLYGVLILRESEPTLLDDQSYSMAWDLYCVTCISLMTVAMGLASWRINVLYGDLRFGPAERLTDPTVPQPPAPLIKSGWSWQKYFIWAVGGLAMPAVCLGRSSIFEHVYPDAGGMVVAWLWSLCSVLLAVGTSFGVLCALGAAQQLLLGGIAEPCGLLPVEAFGFVPKGPPAWLHKLVRWWVGRAGTGLGWLLSGPGYSDPDTKKLYSGHSQMTLIGVLVVATYLCWYVISTPNLVWLPTGWASEWSQYLWPSAFYALLLVYLAGWGMSGAAFCLDRYGLMPEVVLLIWSAILFSTDGTDHTFEMFYAESIGPNAKPQVDDRPRAQAMYEQRHYERYVERRGGDQVAEEESLAPLTRLVNRSSAEQPHETLDPLSLTSAFENWEFPVADGLRTLVVVTAAGGGIQASAWTAKVLTELDRTVPGFSEAVGIVSAVSGGSVGSMYYLAHRGPRTNDSVRPMKISDDDRKRILDAAMSSSLEAVCWGVLFPDLVRSVFPPAAPSEDRGWALESSWWNRLGHGYHHRSQMQDIRLRDLIPAVRECLLPAPVFNATVVETGQRALMSPLDCRNGGQERPQDEYTFVDQPIDFLDFYSVPSRRLLANPRLTTVVRLSSTFSYVTPVAKPALLQEDQLNRSRHLEESGVLDRFNLHYCDGGYADNSGLVTAVSLVRQLLGAYAQRASQDPDFVPPFQRVVIVRIEAFPRRRAQTAKENTGFSSALFGPGTAMYATRVSTQAERSNLELQLLRESAYDRFQVLELQSWQLLMAAVDKARTLLAESGLARVKEMNPISDAFQNMARTPSAPRGTPSQPLTYREQAQKAVQQLSELAREMDVPELGARVARMPSLQPMVTDLKGPKETVRDVVLTAADEIAVAHQRLTQLDRQRIALESVTFRFAQGSPPLSWTLAPSQQRQIQKAWDEVERTWSRSAVLESDSISVRQLAGYFSGATNQEAEEEGSDEP